ncbi:HisA/HisF-related TIM barrel protein [Aliikangiella sp. IMCC44359]|uniref:HisA/HisF-related TIM barrel protein n=1 Tax=Aliikangiella sp. IMCC44359 TaxID=3459125 RepID=UPI00403A952A
MQLVPVLDIRHGKSVHTKHKNNSVDEVIKEDALEVVKRWVDDGISRMHIVDVDAIATGEPENVDLIAKIKVNYPDLKLQVIGGIKSVESAYVWIDAGVDYLVLNSKATKRRNLLDDICFEFPNRVLVEIDSCLGKQTNGAAYDSSNKLIHFAKQLEEDGVAGLVITDIGATRELVKNNFSLIEGVASSIEIPIYINGGIEKVNDIKLFLESSSKKLSGILVGKVLYSDSFSLYEANGLINQYQS